MATERTLRLGIDARGMRRGARDASRSLGVVKASASGATRALQALGFAVGAGGVLGVMGALARESMAFEDAMTGVAKTVDLTASEFREMGEAIKAMSAEIPATTRELAGVAQAAGQLGIQKDAILDFTRVMTDLGVATNLTSEEAATAIARFANVMGTAQDQFDRIGSTVVDLGNNLATTEAEIVAFSTRMAGAGKIAGLTEANVLSIGGALSSVGVEAEAGGTAVQKVLIDINTAVAQGNKDLALFAKTAGLSAEEFATTWQDDAGMAFTAFVEGLGDAGDDAVTILEDLGLNNQRLIRSFLSLGNAGSLLRESIERGNVAWRENNALTKEAERFYATTSNQLKTLKNRVANWAAEMGDNLVPALRWATENTDILHDAIVSLTIAAGVGGAVLAFNAFGAAAIGTTGAFLALVPAINSVSAAVSLLQIAIGPAGWAVLGITALATAVFGLRRHMRESADATREQARALDELRGAFRQDLTGQTRSELEETIELLERQQDIFKVGLSQNLGNEKNLAALREVNQQLLTARELLADMTSGGGSSGGGGGGIEGVAEILEEVDKQLRVINEKAEIFGRHFNAAQERADLFRSAIDSLLDKGLTRASDEVQNMVEQWREARREAERLEAVANRISLAAAVVASGARTGREAREAALVGTLPEGAAAEALAHARRELTALGNEADRLAQRLDESTRGFVALADGLGFLEGASRDAVRGLSDLIGGIDALQGDGSLNERILAGLPGILGGIGGILGSVFGDSERDQLERERNKILEENNRRLVELREGLDGGLRGVTAFTLREIFPERLETARERFENQRSSPSGGFRSSIEAFLDEVGLSLTQLQAIAEEAGVRIFDTAGRIIPEALDQLGIAAQELARRIEENQAAFQQELEVRRLAARGRDAEAEALRRQIDNERERQEALDAGFDAATLRLLGHVQALEAEAEAAARATEQARQRQTFLDDIATRRAALTPGGMDDIQVAFDIQGRRELDAARDLVEAGTITEAMFRDLARLLDDELTNALENAAEAVRRTARDFELDLRLRQAELIGGPGRDIRTTRLRHELRAARELDAARDLLDAGTITANQFERLGQILDLELNRALKDAADAANEAAEAERFRQMIDIENLRVRLLSVQGRDKEAEALRNQIELQEAINDGRSDEYLALLRQIHATQRQRDAIEETTRAIDGMTRALNAPAGFRLALNRFRATDPAFRAAQSGGGSSSGPVTIQVFARPGQNAEQIAREVKRVWEREARSGGSPMILSEN